MSDGSDLMWWNAAHASLVIDLCLGASLTQECAPAVPTKIEHPSMVIGPIPLLIVCPHRLGAVLDMGALSVTQA